MLRSEDKCTQCTGGLGPSVLVNSYFYLCQIYAAETPSRQLQCGSLPGFQCQQWWVVEVPPTRSRVAVEGGEWEPRRVGAQASVRNGQRAPLFCPGSFLHFPGQLGAPESVPHRWPSLQTPRSRPSGLGWMLGEDRARLWYFGPLSLTCQHVRPLWVPRATRPLPVK